MKKPLTRCRSARPQPRDLFPTARRDRLPRCIAIGLALCAALVVGCASTQNTTSTPINMFSHFRSSGLESSPVRRVLLLPMSNETRFPHAESDIRDALAAELRAAGLFEVVSCPCEIGESWAAALREHGRFDELNLIEITERFQVDGVIYGSLTDYCPYWPPRIGVNLHLVSTHEAVTLASVDGVWDTRDEYVASQAQRFYDARLSPKSRDPEGELMLHAPQLFQKFVANQIVHLLAGPLGSPPDGMERLPVDDGPKNSFLPRPIAKWWPW